MVEYGRKQGSWARPISPSNIPGTYVAGVRDYACRANSGPKFLALCRFARVKASSREQRNVSGCLATQRSPDVRDEKKKMKWQNFTITLTADEPKACASGMMKETTAPAGSTDSIRSGVTTRRTGSPLSGSGDTTRAGRPRTPGVNRPAQAHQVDNLRPATSKR